MGWLLRWSPIGRLTAALWAWRNRREVGRWLGFAWRAVPPSSGDRDDLIAEARLRGALAKDARTRGAPSLSVHVADRTAFLEGRLPPDLHDLVVSIARRTKGIEAVECNIIDRGRRRTPMSHAHTIGVPPLPPPPSSRDADGAVGASRHRQSSSS